MDPLSGPIWTTKLDTGQGRRFERTSYSVHTFGAHVDASAGVSRIITRIVGLFRWFGSAVETQLAAEVVRLQEVKFMDKIGCGLARTNSGVRRREPPYNMRPNVTALGPQDRPVSVIRIRLAPPLFVKKGKIKRFERKLTSTTPLITNESVI